MSDMAACTVAAATVGTTTLAGTVPRGPGSLGIYLDALSVLNAGCRTSGRPSHPAPRPALHLLTLVGTQEHRNTGRQDTAGGRKAGTHEALRRISARAVRCRTPVPGSRDPGPVFCHAHHRHPLDRRSDRVRRSATPTSISRKMNVERRRGGHRRRSATASPSSATASTPTAATRSSGLLRERFIPRLHGGRSGVAGRTTPATTSTRTASGRR